MDIDAMLADVDVDDNLQVSCALLCVTHDISHLAT